MSKCYLHSFFFFFFFILMCVFSLPLLLAFFYSSCCLQYLPHSLPSICLFCLPTLIHRPFSLCPCCIHPQQMYSNYVDITWFFTFPLSNSYIITSRYIILICRCVDKNENNINIDSHKAITYNTTNAMQYWDINGSSVIEDWIAFLEIM